MIYIDFEGKTPVNTPSNSSRPSWKPWTQKRWDKWLKTSKDHLEEITRLNSIGDVKERNKYIDSKSAHWGKLKPWLEVLSYGKCWFSEVKEKYSHYDIEHFRPKKKCKEIDGSIKDGYWWLAFDYTNYRLCGNVGNRKKGGWFPLKENSLCSDFNCRCEESEANYFLDPTDPDDPNLLAFDEEGNAIPSPDCKSDWERDRAKESIKRLKLVEHEPLTNARREIWQKINIEIELYLSAKKKAADGINPGAKQKVKQHLLIIKSLSLPNAELSSVAKWCIHFRNDPQLSRLVA